MGGFSVDMELANTNDLVQAEGEPSLPVRFGGSRFAGRYADGRTALRDIAWGIHLSCGGREGLFSAVVEPDRDSALIGAFVMEELDLIIDCTSTRLIPRDPNQIISEIE
jgi:hypothetical protein